MGWKTHTYHRGNQEGSHSHLGLEVAAAFLSCSLSGSKSKGGGGDREEPTPRMERINNKTTHTPSLRSKPASPSFPATIPTGRGRRGLCLGKRGRGRRPPSTLLSSHQLTYGANPQHSASSLLQSHALIWRRGRRRGKLSQSHRRKRKLSYQTLGVGEEERRWRVKPSSILTPVQVPNKRASSPTRCPCHPCSAPLPHWGGLDSLSPGPAILPLTPAPSPTPRAAPSPYLGRVPRPGRPVAPRGRRSRGCSGNKSSCSSPAPSAGQAGPHLANHGAPRTAVARRRRILSGQGEVRTSTAGGEGWRGVLAVPVPDRARRLAPLAAIPGAARLLAARVSSGAAGSLPSCAPPPPMSLRGQTRPEPGGLGTASGRAERQPLKGEAPWLGLASLPM